METITEQLEHILEQRKTEDVKTSYVAALYANGDEAILKKIIEETGEVIMATKDNDNDKIIYEVADLYFHILVLLKHRNIATSQIACELKRRLGESGIVEKNNRSK